VDVTAQSTKMKSFTYRTNSTWSGGQSSTLASNGKPLLQVSTPLDPRGAASAWTPEEMFVGAVELCHMNTFLMFAGRQQMKVVSYESHANGVLELVDGDYRFTRIVIFPTIEVQSPVKVMDVHALLRDAERHCLLANSIASIVEMNPTIIVRDDNHDGTQTRGN
jgi:organic hydroperoxide reductase OsmC/OhrA